MGLEPDFLDLSATTVSVEPLSTHDAYGAPSFGTAVTYNAVLDLGPKLVNGPDGRKELSGGMVFVLSTSASIGLQDRLTVRGSVYRILSVSNPEDEEGQHHLEITLGVGGAVL